MAGSALAMKGVTMTDMDVNMQARIRTQIKITKRREALRNQTLSVFNTLCEAKRNWHKAREVYDETHARYIAFQKRHGEGFDESHPPSHKPVRPIRRAYDKRSQESRRRRNYG
jgi:hypothetical protein